MKGGEDKGKERGTRGGVEREKREKREKVGVKRGRRRDSWGENEGPKEGENFKAKKERRSEQRKLDFLRTQKKTKKKKHLNILRRNVRTIKLRENG